MGRVFLAIVFVASVFLGSIPQQGTAPALVADAGAFKIMPDRRLNCFGMNDCAGVRGITAPENRTGESQPMIGDHRRRESNTPSFPIHC